MTEKVERAEVVIRRAPKLGVFLAAGGLVGAVATLILTSLFEPDPNVGFSASFAYFLLYGIPAGIALGALAGLLLDARSRRRVRVVTAERDVVEDAPPHPELESGHPELETGHPGRGAGGS